MGAFLLAAVYHTSLFYFRKSALLAYYSIYLWASFFHITFDAICFSIPGVFPRHLLIISDMLLIGCNQFYFVFIAKTFGIRRSSGIANTIYKASFGVFSFFLLSLLSLRLGIADGAVLGKFLNLFLWPAVAAGAVIWLVLLLRKQHDLLHVMIGCGSFILVLFNIIAFFNVLITFKSFSHINQHFQTDSFTITCIGFFLEIILFSAAMGVNVRAGLQARLAANEKLISQQQLLLKSELQKEKEIIQSRQKERLHISGDMQDELNNALTSLKLYAGDLKANTSDKKLFRILAQAEEEINATALLVASFISRLNNNYADFDYDLSSFLGTLAADFKGTSLEIIIDADKDDIAAKLSARQQSYIYLIIKEAFTNVLKYADATSLLLRIELKDDVCRIKIADNGRGMEGKHAEGLGLQNMRERVEELKGQISFYSSGKGMEINAVFAYN